MKEFNNQNKKNVKYTNQKRKIRKNKLNNIERAKFADMNQIEWFPVDPYCD